MKAHIKEAWQRLTGFTIGPASASWNPPPPERAVANKVIAFLSDRRVLYYSTEFEYPNQCVESVFKIREQLTEALGDLEADSVAAEQIRGMLAECGQFLDTCQQDGLGVTDLRKYPYPAKHWEFIDALSQLRRGFGFHIAALSGAYDIELAPCLQRILPPAPNDA
jgi:hypothetical protein